MKKITKIAAIAAALCLAAFMTAGCRNEAQITKDLDAVIAGSEQLIALESGEIMIYESVKLATDVEGLAVNSVTESYAKYVGNGTELEYDLGATVTVSATGENTFYNARKEGGVFTQSLNDEVISESEMAAPDLFDRFRVTYAAADVENIDVLTGNGVTVYAVTMTGAYADTFDTAADGATYDCTRMVYNYYIDDAGVLRQVLSEQNATLTDASGESQEVTKFSEAAAE